MRLRKYWLCIVKNKNNDVKYLFVSSWKNSYSDRGIRKILMKYTKEAGIEHLILLLSHIKTFSIYLDEEKSVDDTLIQPYSGHDRRQSLEYILNYY